MLGERVMERRCVYFLDRILMNGMHTFGALEYLNVLIAIFQFCLHPIPLDMRTYIVSPNCQRVQVKERTQTQKERDLARWTELHMRRVVVRRAVDRGAVVQRAVGRGAGKWL